MLSKKKIVATFFAGALCFGIMTGTSSVQAAPAAVHAGYELSGLADSNDFSARMHQEDLTHEQIVHSLRYEYRRDGDRAKYDRDLREEQKRHDKAVQKIKDDYNHYARKHRQ